MFSLSSSYYSSSDGLALTSAKYICYQTIANFTEVGLVSIAKAKSISTKKLAGELVPLHRTNTKDSRPATAACTCANRK